MEKVQINFDMMHDKRRGEHETLTRTFEPGFVSVDCGIEKSFLKWTHLLSTEVSLMYMYFNHFVYMYFIAIFFIALTKSTCIFALSSMNVVQIVDDHND